MKRLLLPLGAYLLLTLVLPALHGGWARPAFWRHALWVVAIAAAVLAMIALLHTCWEWTARLARSAHSTLRRRRGVLPHDPSGARS